MKERDSFKKLEGFLPAISIKLIFDLNNLPLLYPPIYYTVLLFVLPN